MRDTEVAQLIADESARQESVVNLIASENIVSDDVREALGSVFTNKYAEGYPGARYYGGNSVVDALETLTQSRALSLFGLDADEWSVNVQALSGSPANIAVYTALVPQGGSIMGLALDQGGHLTHGHKASVSGKWWRQVSYTLNQETELLDYDAIKEIALREKPDVIIAGYTAYSRVIDWARFREIADAVGAHLHVDLSHTAGLVVGGAFPSPFPYADTVMTTVHKSLRGPRAALIFSKVDDRKLGEKINKAVFPGLQGGPHINQIAATAVALHEASLPSFCEYAAQVVQNARALASALSEKGWRIVSGGTDSHLFLVDTWMNGDGVSGGVASDALEAVGIVVNKNTIPFDTRSPSDPSGIRIGTLSETTRGKTVEDMVLLAGRIDEALRSAITNR